MAYLISIAWYHRHYRKRNTAEKWKRQRDLRTLVHFRKLKEI
uniref:Bm1480, isoform b n=1 Tax=Brugia malayi TaxID=6279 RepID=A0A1I9G4I7_BRUMA|nr:Bm1480, isoform b [Brugia malayi]